MAEATEQDATYQDILALPPHVTGQIVFGVLLAHPRPDVLRRRPIDDGVASS